MIDTQSETWLEIVEIAQAEKQSAITQLTSPNISERQSDLCRGKIAAYNRILEAPTAKVVEILSFDDYN